MASPFALTAPALIERGYSPLPILPPDAPKAGAGKAPALSSWQRYCNEAPTSFFVAGYSRAPALGIGIATGFRDLVAVDIDGYDAIVGPILSALPPARVVKIGRKGLTSFYRSAERMESRSYNDANGIRLLDFLSGGRQTVLPPSIHPGTGRPYYWWSDATLEDTPLEGLPVLTHKHRAAMEEILGSFGWQPDRPHVIRGEAFTGPTAFPESSMFRRVNDLAMVNLHAWVPELGLKRWYRAGPGFKAVAHWRPSGSGRAFYLRSPNLSFRADGIVDFGDGNKGYTPIDVVMASHHCLAGEALDWLAPRVGIQLHDAEAAEMAERIVATAAKKKELTQ